MEGNEEKDLGKGRGSKCEEGCGMSERKDGERRGGGDEEE